jgi:hypothetical protein
MLRILVLWLPMVALGIANGVLREATYGKHMPELRAHQLSTLVAIGLLGAYMAVVMRWWPPETAAHAWVIGAVWVGATIGFEFLFGRLVAGHSWTRLFQDYNLAAGRVWVVVPVWIAIAPRVFYSLWR